MWTFIRTAKEFIHALREFFEYSERELVHEFPEDRTWIEKISTDLIQYIQTDEFLEQSIERTRQNPTLQDPRAMPWEYISGGTMPALLMAYYSRHAPLSQLKKIIHNEQELMLFLESCASKVNRSALMHSPTHAFIFQPHWLPSDLHQSILQMQNFWKQMKVEDAPWLVEKLALRLPEKESAMFIHRWRQFGMRGEFLRFRKGLIELLGVAKEPFIDSFLLESLPLINPTEAGHLASELGLSTPFEDSWITPVEFREKAKSAFIAKQRSPFSSLDLDEKIVTLLRQKGFAAPSPILFADTNWSAWFFGLAISPSGSLQLWRFSRTAMSGIPMNAWFRLQCGGEWIILDRPQEYTFG
jgi:hypothetical protein